METDPPQIAESEQKVAPLSESLKNSEPALLPTGQVPVPMPAPPRPARLTAPPWELIRRVAGPFSLAALLAVLLWKTWLRWPEPLVDFPNFLYLPWRISQGDLLYRDLVCIYGPLPPLVQAGAFHLFGPGLDVIIWLNIAVTAGVLALVYGIFRMVGDCFSAWLCGVVFLVVFALQLYGEPVSNFIAPYSCQGTWGFGGVLLTVFALLRHGLHPRRRWLVVAGLGVGIAFLNKPELLFAALGALGIFLTLDLLKSWRLAEINGGAISVIRFAGVAMVCISAGFLTAYLPVFFALAHAGGWSYGFRAANWSLQVFLNPDYTKATTTHIQTAFLGFDHFWPYLFSHVQWGLVFVAFCLIAGWAGRRWLKAQSAGRPGQGFLGLFLALCFLIVLNARWLSLGRTLLVPAILTALATVGYSLRRAWQRLPDVPRLPGLAVVATSALLMLARMILNGRIFGAGLFEAVLATLLLVHILIYELPWRFGDGTKPNSLLQTTLALVVLAGVVALGQLSQGHYESRIFQVGTGRDRFYADTPEINPDGIYLNTVITVMREHFKQVKTVIAFPETMAVNYHLRLTNPIPDVQFVPDTILMAGLDNLLAKLTAHPPEAVVLTARRLPEYGVPYFGADPGGKALIEWVKANYSVGFYGGNSTISLTGHTIDIFIRRDLAAGYGKEAK